MYDLDQIKRDIGDLRPFLTNLLGLKAKGLASKAWNYPCPLHHEQRGESFAIYEDGWKCFGACDAGGDVLAFLQRYWNCDLKEVCKRLNAKETLVPRMALTGSKPKPQPEPYPDPPSPAWQKAARALIADGVANLWGVGGSKARDYLAGRGFHETVLREAQIGYMPGKPFEWLQLHGLTIPTGILIPNVGLGNVWNIRVRRAAGMSKYQGVKDGKLIGGLFWGDTIRHGQPVLIVEGEFDALAVWQAARDLISPVALSSASNHITPNWLDKLIMVPRIFARMDGDKAGKQAMERLGSISSRVKPVQVPAPHKDVNDLLIAGGNKAVRDWVKDFLGIQDPETLELPPEPPKPRKKRTPKPPLPIAGFVPAVAMLPAPDHDCLQTWLDVVATWDAQIERIRAEMTAEQRPIWARINHMKNDRRQLSHELADRIRRTDSKLYKRYTRALFSALENPTTQRQRALLSIKSIERKQRIAG